MTWQPRRRRFLQGMFVTAAGSLAGCSNDSSSNDQGNGSTTGAPTTASKTAPPSTTSDPTPSATATRTTVPNPEERAKRWLKNANNYDGTIADKTNEVRVTVSVGADGKNDLDGFAFDPPGIRIETGTEVTWLWTGEGGKHNVMEIDGRFTSGTPESGGGTTYIRTFEEPGLYRYKCSSHGNALNMRGAVIVEY